MYMFYYVLLLSSWTLLVAIARITEHYDFDIPQRKLLVVERPPNEQNLFLVFKRGGYK